MESKIFNPLIYSTLFQHELALQKIKLLNRMA